MIDSMRAEVVEGALLREDGSFAPARLEIRDGVVLSREDGGGGAELVAPGLVDLQVNGAAGASVTDGREAIAHVDEAMLDAGVTSWLATVMTTDDATVATVVKNAAAVHLEGPFLSPELAGAHRVEYLRVPGDGVPVHFEHPAVRLVTLAPELPGGVELARELDSRGVVVSLGHSDATPEQAGAVPARMVTHLFNAMRPPHHRLPTLPTWALVHDSVAVGLISDGLHVDPLVLRLIRRVAGDRIVLVSDASPATAAPEGEYSLQGIPIRRVGDECRDELGRLAGTAIDLAEGVRRYVRFTGASLGEALVAATFRPARLAGIGGILGPGDPADLVTLDRDGRVLRVMRGGVWVR
jgi:N-acetylglucosamine-6-phosphate deacetylase